MAPLGIRIGQFNGRPRVLGISALIVGALLALALGQALSRPQRAPATPRHTAVTIQRASATAVGQIARPTMAPSRSLPLVTWKQGGGTGEHHHHKGGG